MSSHLDSLESYILSVHDFTSGISQTTAHLSIYFTFSIQLLIAESNLKKKSCTKWKRRDFCVSVSGASGIYQNNLFRVAAFLPKKYTNAIIFGNVSCSSSIE